MTPKTKAHIFGLGLDARGALIGGHHAPSILSAHPTFRDGKTDYLVYIVTYDPSNLKSVAYLSAIQLLDPTLVTSVPAPLHPLNRKNPALHKEKPSSNLFPDTWTQNQIIDAIKEAFRDSWVKNRTLGYHFEGMGGSGFAIEGYLAYTDATMKNTFIRTAAPK